MKKATVIISKIDWESLLARITRKINIFYQDSDLRHYFGDYPEKYVVRVEIREIGREQPEEKKEMK